MAATKRIGTFVLALVFLFCVFAVPLVQPAHALAGVIVIGAVISVMALAGITLAAAGITSAQLQDWVGGKLDDWAAARGSTVDQLISTSLIGTTINGMLMVGKSAADGINDFITWLRSETGLGDNDSVSIIESGGLDLSEYFNISIPGTASVSQNVITFNQSSYSSQSVSFTSKTANTSVIEYDISFNATQNSNAGNLYPTIAIRVNDPAAYSEMDNCYRDGNFLKATFTNGQSNGSAHVVLQSTGFSISYVYSRGTVTISNILINDTQAGQPNQSLELQTGVITYPQVNQDEKIFLDVGALPGSTVTEVTSGVIDDVITDTLTVSGTVAEEEPEYVIEGATPVYGLEDVFPFCIPFDLYDFVGCLAAEPVAPHFEWRLYVENLVDYTFVVDFEDFETVAQILRTMELLLFIIGLAMVTRHILRS